MELTATQQEKIIDLYVTHGWRITPVIYELMRETGLRWKDLYTPISEFLHSRGVMRRGHGPTFHTKDFKWKEKTCAACQETFQPSNAYQRFCTECTGDNPSLVIGYGITADDYQSLYEQQDGLCGICRLDLSALKPRAIHLDHCHRTARIRGILCSSCNQKLSALEDTTWIIAAQKYLTKPGIEPRCDCTNLRKIVKASDRTG